MKKKIGLNYNFIFPLRVYLCKQWTELKTFNDHTATATGVRFGRNSQWLASTSMDRTLKLYGIE
jgi:pre-mRNA-processing factor 19